MPTGFTTLCAVASYGRAQRAGNRISDIATFTRAFKLTNHDTPQYIADFLSEPIREQCPIETPSH